MFRASKFFHLSSSLMSFNHALFMSRLNPFIVLATSVVKRNVGGGVSPSPCPTISQRFTPYSQFASLHSVSKKSIDSSSPSHSVQVLNHSRISSHKTAFLPSSQSPTTSKIFLSESSEPPASALPLSSTQLTSIPPSQTCKIAVRALQASRDIIHNSFRPRVAAADCLFKWDTPFGIQHKE